MTSHLQKRMQTELTWPTGMPVGEDFATAAQSGKSIMLHSARTAQYAKLRRYRHGMSTGIYCFQTWIGSTGNFKSP